MPLLPGFLMLAMAVAYFVSEIIVRGRTGWKKGPLNFATKPVVLLPLGIYLVAAVLLSTASWSILNLTSVLVVFGLPMALGASYGAFAREPARGASMIAATLSILGLVTVWVGAQA